MSKDYWLFEKETGDIGFLAGVVDVLSDNLGMLLDYAYALDADVFFVKDNDMSLLNDSVKKRLHYYNIRYGLHISEKEIDALDFELIKSDADPEKVLCDFISNYSSKKDVLQGVKEFFTDLNWYLQKPLCIYNPVRLPDHNIDVLGSVYLYMAWDYFFIAYYDYLVLFVLGTVE